MNDSLFNSFNATLFNFRFWIMASTFTGLKLQGELGRFGTTEISDIAGKYSSSSSSSSFYLLKQVKLKAASRQADVDLQSKIYKYINIGKYEVTLFINN